MALPGVGLSNDDVDERHPVAVPVVQPPHGYGAAARDRAGVGDEVKEHWTAPQVAEAEIGAVGRPQCEVGCLLAGPHARRLH
jgi:hypothetical protein